MANQVHLLVICTNPNCKHHHHLLTVPEGTIMPSEVVVGRLGNKARKLLEIFNDSDTYHAALSAIAAPFNGETWNQSHMLAEHYEYINKETVAHCISPLKNSMKEPEKTEEQFPNRVTAIDGFVVTTDVLQEDAFKVIHYKPDPMLNGVQNAEARLHHYNSEIQRLEALSLAQSKVH